MDTKERWRPNFGEIVAVGACVAAAIMWFKPPNWEWGLPITAILIALVIFTAVRHQSHPIRRLLVATVAVIALVWAAAEPIWKSFRADYPNIAFQSPISFNAPIPSAPNDPLAAMGYFGHSVAWMKRPIIGRTLVDNSRIDDLSFAGVNVKGEEVEVKDAYAISGVDGSRLELKMMTFDPFQIAPPIDVRPIPARAPIFLTAQLNGMGGISESDFRQHWATYSLVVEYRGDIPQRVLFDQGSVADALSSVTPHASARQ